MRNLPGVLIIFLLAHSVVQAQSYPKLSTMEVEKRAKYYRQLRAEVEAGQTYRVSPSLPFTSLALRAPQGTDWSRTYLVIEQDTFRIQSEEHETDGLPYRQGALIVWDQPVRQFLLHTGDVRGTITLSLLNAQSSRVPLPARRLDRGAANNASLCEKPEYVPQDEWRAGLPPPTYRRLSTRVEHVIVHHSATYNHLTNYENVVRNIYLFHTQDRGWSDIGYNFLVAPDGTLFEGRSAGEQDIVPDNIQGAHFCSRNSGTMGVCLLGNYNTAVPTDTALATIVKVSSWKLTKEDLDPLGIIAHPTNADLGVIAGHRDGCDTECPGDNLYARLDEVRRATQARIAEGCPEDLQALNVYPVPAEGSLTIDLPRPDPAARLNVLDMQGRDIELPFVQAADDQLQLSTLSLARGVYLVEVRSGLSVFTRKILVR